MCVPNLLLAGRFAGRMPRQLRIDPAQTLRVSLGTLAESTVGGTVLQDVNATVT